MKALGDSNRFRIVMMLRERPMCVCELLEILDIAGGTLSGHLNVLKHAGLIKQRKDGKWIEYFIHDTGIHNLLAEIDLHIKDRSLLIQDRNSVGSVSRSQCSIRTKNY